jgi:hypothetical protein
VKAAFSFLSIIIALGIVWILYVNQLESSQGPSGMLGKAEREKVPRGTPTTAPAGQAQQQDRAIPANQIQSTPIRQTRPPAVRQKPSPRSEIYKVASETGVKIMSYQEQGSQATLICSASEHIKLGDFLDVLTRRRIIRDFDYNNRDLQVTRDRQGRRSYKCKYVLKW